MDQNTLIGTDVSRLDGVEKASGFAKYANDVNTPGTLYAKLLTCPHAHARLKTLDVEPAKKVPGVKAVHIFDAGKVDNVLEWDGVLIAAVAAETPEQAEDGIRAIKVEYEVLEHFVDEADLKGAEGAGRAKAPQEQTKGDVAAALEKAKVVHKGHYGIHTITHCCMEPHGSHCEWSQDGNEALTANLSTQNVSGTAGQFAGPLGVDASKVTVICNYIGGGFGSKFAAGEWSIAAARLAKEAGRPVRLMLDRATELKTAGQRPSGFADVTIAADEAGRIIAWESTHWGSNGVGGQTVAVTQYPYVFDFDNRNRKAIGISTNTGPPQAWRAPNHPQLCAMTCTAIDDLAAKLGMDSYDVFLKNLDQVTNGKADVYKAEMEIGARLIDWKKNAHPHGKGKAEGPWKRGLGMALHTWGGAAHNGKCIVKVHADGTVESTSGSQDIGTGTKTVIAIVLAETFGIPLEMVKVNIGSSRYPASGPSGGSTTVGGVSGPNRRAALNLLWQVFDKVAAKYNVPADSLTAKGGKILNGNQEVCTWKDAARLVGPMGIEAEGTGATNDGLTDRQVGGIQMADVSVDTETGKIKINKFVAVQDCGLIIDMKTAKSQVLGGLIMGIAFAITEERIMDNKTGRFINADFENYKLPRIGDIGELVVEMYQPESEYKRGVIGLGEPPVISPGAAISNAVANAIGVRVPVLPMTPKRVLDALEKGANS
jgi:xanthine dehydrogenase YagR molybdenum-binding subunit